ncbi:MAG: TcpQ domain-containing protein [Francisellaceae bacterium]
MKQTIKESKHPKISWLVSAVGAAILLIGSANANASGFANDIVADSQQFSQNMLNQHAQQKQTVEASSTVMNVISGSDIYIKHLLIPGDRVDTQSPMTLTGADINVMPITMASKSSIQHKIDTTKPADSCHRFCSIKGQTLYQTLERWFDDKQQVVFENVPNFSISQNKHYNGSVDGDSKSDNIIYQLLIDNMHNAISSNPASSINSFGQSRHIIRFSALMQQQLLDHSINNIDFFINQSDNVIAFAGKDKQAYALSQKIPDVYYLIKGQTIRDSLNRWAKANGYLIYYQTEVDFKIQQNAVLFGQLLSEKGPLYTLLSSLQSTPTPIKAEVMDNNVILIKPDTYSSKFLIPSQDNLNS